MKIKKQHRKKNYLHKLNRKRMHVKQRSTGDVNCKPIKDAWDFKKSSLRNMKEMGLATDPNKVIKIPNIKQEKVRIAKKIVNQDDTDDEEDIDEVVQIVPKKEVVEILEKEARAPRARRFILSLLPGRRELSCLQSTTFLTGPVAYLAIYYINEDQLQQKVHIKRLPKPQVEFITYLLDKYGHDYKAMAKDKKNYYQETWKQLRAKVKTFMGIPKQYSEYLAARGLLDKDIDEAELKKQAKALIMDDD